MWTPFNRLFTTGRELDFIRQAIEASHLSGDGGFTKKCQEWLEQHTGSPRAFLTHSCTAALEMIAILLDIKPGDEIIMPSFTFVSTANAFVLRGGVPVFVDIDPETLNIDVRAVEAAITRRTRAIVAVHYAGQACDMDELVKLATRYQLFLVEDAAQGISASYHDRPLGSIGHLAGLSFHETKNVISGEGGALLINDLELIERAEVIREKGTNRSRFFRGQVDKYTWVDVGSSFLPSELIAAFLWAQLAAADEILTRRLALWDSYHQSFADLEEAGLVRRPIIRPDRKPNGHLYYLLLRNLEERTKALHELTELGVNAVFHYVPLHNSPAGLKYGRSTGELPVTSSVSERLVRLPLWVAMSEDHPQHVIGAMRSVLADRRPIHTDS